MYHDHLRSMTSNKANPIGGALFEALKQTGEMSPRAMRECGFRSLAPLTDRAQLAIDTAVVKVGRERLSFVKDIMDSGLTYNLPDALGYTMLEWQKESARVGAAQRSMSPSVRQENKLPGIAAAYLPVYITSDGFSLDIRTLKMSQRLGTPFDTNLVEQCTRSVNEAIEDAAINGATTIDGQELKVGGYAAPGLLNAPNANTKAISVSWATATGAQIFADVAAMIALAQADYYFGPYNLYVGTAANINLDSDYSTLYPGVTIRERLLKIEGLNKIGYADMMPTTKAALVQMTSDVVDMVDGIRPTVIPYTSLDGFHIHNVVMAIQIPRFRSNASSGSGIVIGTWS